MADTHKPEVRSYNMSRVRSKNTKPELVVRKFIFGQGLRYRTHNGNLPGKPDIVLRKYMTVIFIHGCFWHSHNGCKRFKLPKSGVSYWIPKLARNMENDRKHLREIRKLGWKAIVFWECQLTKKLDDTLTNLLTQIKCNP